MIFSHLLTWVETDPKTGISKKKSQKTNSAYFQSNVRTLRKIPTVSNIRCEKL